ncbi:hypothetical protein GCM10023196_068430 [Actinoallomurus vinaceus]|uniref:Uncharacterized protein n=1 Tax=Actinoallomurus vinaceus TaxID=1080074 RepID=A0ABP8ULL1_9ACTN
MQSEDCELDAEEVFGVVEAASEHCLDRESRGLKYPRLLTKREDRRLLTGGRFVSTQAEAVVVQGVSVGQDRPELTVVVRFHSATTGHRLSALSLTCLEDPT